MLISQSLLLHASSVLQQFSWRIAARETKPLARVSFEADVSGLYSGMVYLKSEYDNQVGVPVNLALPVRITARTGARIAIFVLCF